MLLCDGKGCERVYHTRCLSPSLDAVPEGDWMCPVCSSGSALSEQRSATAEVEIEVEVDVEVESGDDDEIEVVAEMMEVGKKEEVTMASEAAREVVTAASTRKKRVASTVVSTDVSTRSSRRKPKLYV